MLQQPATKYRPFAPIGLKDRTWPDAVLTKPPIWLSTDLRDGNQSLIEPMSVERKLELFPLLVDIGFKEIEGGFPSASQTEFNFVRRLIDENRIPDDVSIQVLTQAREGLIRRTIESLAGVKKAIVHVYNPCAPVMRKVVLGLDEDGIVDMAVTQTKLVKQLVAEHPETEWGFEYSPEMFSDTELPFSKRVVDAVVDAWGGTPENRVIINLPSTVEHSTPNIFADMIEWMHRNLAKRDSIIMSVHPHNDRGTGIASAELALMAGADRLEGCLFGHGERTGNCDLANVALNLYTQGVSPGLDFSDIDEIRRVVEGCTQMATPPRHPYVGDLVYTSFSGSHQDAIRKAFAARKEGDLWDMPYLPIDPKDLGRTYEAVIRVNSQSGKGGMAYLLESEYGLELPRRLQIEFSRVVQQETDVSGKELLASDLWNLFRREYGLDSIAAPKQRAMSESDGSGNTRVTLKAEVQLGGRPVTIEGEGTGPVDAFVAGLNATVLAQVKVMDYREHAIGSGANAQAVAYLELRVGDRTLYGVGMDADILTASLKGILSGLARAGV